MNASQEKRWLQFCRDYVPVKDSDGRFVLEARWTDKENERRNLAVIRYGDTIKRYDLTLFNSIYLNREKGTYSAIWQQYAAVMCALLCNTDAETSQAFMDTCDFTAEEPIIGMRKIAADGAYLRRAESSSLHILSLVRKESISAIDAQIWKAQLQVLFRCLKSREFPLLRGIENRCRRPWAKSTMISGLDDHSIFTSSAKPSLIRITQSLGRYTA